MFSNLQALFSMALAAASVGCLVAGFHSFGKKRLVDDIPTSRTQGVFIGLAEIKGTAESDSPLTSHLAGVLCVQYAWHAEEHWSRTVTETYTDSKGTHTRTRTESGWTNVGGGSQSIPFYLKDETGIIRVLPEGASIDPAGVFEQTCSPGDPLYFGKAPAHEIANSTHRRRFTETALPLHTPLYVMGQARQRQDAVAAEIARDQNSPMFLISVRTERQVSTSFGLHMGMWLALGIAVALGSAAVWDILRPYRNSIAATPYVLAAALFLFAFAAGWLWLVYNSLVTLRQRTRQGWSQVDVQLKRRYGLISNLVTTVEGHRDYERQTQGLLAELRSQAEVAGSKDASGSLKGVAPLLRATVERYPELGAGEAFLKLQQSLVDSEQRIALARDYFNGIATAYNTRLGIIPDRFVATLAGLKPRDLLVAADFERAPIEVKLVL